jgi:hypothetical protein
MQRWNWFRGLAVLAALLLLAGCGGGAAWDTEVLPWIHDVEGTYQARTVVGDWGVVVLQLERQERSRVYKATLANPHLDFFRTRKGIGTLANDHLILNFDTGYTDDFYFEGDVVQQDDIVQGLAGQFIFPDQEGRNLVLEFDRL